MSVAANVVEPVRLSTDNSTAATERVELFSIDGKGYSVPAKPRPNLGLKYLWSLRSSGNQELAMAELLVSLLGDEGYQALMNFDDLTPSDFESVVSAARDISMGGMESALGNS